MKSWMLLLGLGCVACAGSASHEHRLQPTAAAEAADAAQPEVDASIAPLAPPATGAEADIHFAVITLLVELQRSLQQQCPCEVEAGQFKNMQACEDAVSFSPGWADCVNGVDLPDTELAREQLRCETLSFSMRTDCLAKSHCTDEEVADCLRDKAGCGELDLSVLNPVALKCADKIALNH